jgi:hypothetical protein
MNPNSSKSAEGRNKNAHYPRVKKSHSVRVAVNVSAVRTYISVAEHFAKQKADD